MYVCLTSAGERKGTVGPGERKENVGPGDCFSQKVCKNVALVSADVVEDQIGIFYLCNFNFGA